MAKGRKSSLKETFGGRALLVIGLAIVLCIFPTCAMAARAPIYAKGYGNTGLVTAKRHSLRFQVAPSFEYQEYSTRLSIGTPPREFVGFLDTGSDVVWTQCPPCNGCLPGFPVFEPETSTSYKALSCQNEACIGQNVTSFTSTCSATDICNIELAYGTGVGHGELSSEVLTLNSGKGPDETFPDFTFGCVNSLADGAAPLVALSRANTSLVSQLLPKLGTPSTFSFCFPTYHDNKTTELTLGSKAAKHLPYTPLLPKDSTNYYFVNVTGISVDGDLVPTPIDFFTYNSSDPSDTGTILDSGTSNLLLYKDAYNPLRSAVEDHITYPTGDSTTSEFQAAYPNDDFDLCYNVTAENATSLDQLDLPTITIHLQDLDWELPASNSFIFVSQPDKVITTMCLAINSNPEGTQTIIGNYQMQNHLFFFDLDNNRVGIKSQMC